MSHFFISFSALYQGETELLEAIACAVGSPEMGPRIRKTFVGHVNLGEVSAETAHSVPTVDDYFRGAQIFRSTAELGAAFSKWLPKKLPNRHANRLQLVGNGVPHISEMSRIPSQLREFWTDWYKDYVCPDLCVPNDVSSRPMKFDMGELSELSPCLQLPGTAVLLAGCDYFICGNRSVIPTG